MKLKHARFVVAVAFGSLLWAGCASPRNDSIVGTLDSRPIDLTEFRADTYPEHRNAAFQSQHVVDVYNPVITEAAGAERIADEDVYNEPDVDLYIDRDADVDVKINRQP